VAIYSIRYVEHYSHEMRKNVLSSLTPIFILSMLLVVSSSNMFSFLFFWEIMALSSFFLVMFEYEKKGTARSGLFYFIMTQLSTAFLLVSFLMAYQGTGSFEMDAIKGLQPALVPIVFICMFLGFGIKAGIVPFHKWLPYAHTAAPSNISALMSGVMIKVAIYGLVRFSMLASPGTWWGIMVLVAGTSSAILGVIYALKEHNIKRLLAFHSIENIGIILIGLGLYIIFAANGLYAIALLSLAGSLFHTFNHALFKSLLFMAAGSVSTAAKTLNIEEMGGLVKRMPHTAMLFLIGSVSISALPPFNGFVSELMIFQSFFQSAAIHDPILKVLLIICLSLLALTSALAAACFVKAFGITFLARPRSENAENAKEVPWPMILGPAIPAALCVLLGVFSFQLFSFMGFSFPLSNMLITGSILAAIYIFAAVAMRHAGNAGQRVSETWGCGNESKNARTEYTASGFSEPIVTIFKSIYRTQKYADMEYHDRHRVIFKEGNAGIKLLEFFEKYMYVPASNAVERLSVIVSSMQNGSLSSYIFYVFVAVMALILIAGFFA